MRLMLLTSVLVGTMLYGVVESLTQTTRLVAYYDQWHPNASLDLIGSNGVTHVILAFMLSHHLNNDTFDPMWNAPEPGHKWHLDTLKSIKERYPAVEVGLAIGGWNDDPESGWRRAIQNDANLSRFVRNLHSVVFGEFPIFESHQFDSIDIDWEYPGGEGVDYKSNPLDADQAQLEAVGYAKLLQAIRTDIAGSGKQLSIAVPGKPHDMEVFNNDSTTATIFQAVDLVNLMSYDLFNRRDKITAHHSSFRDSLEAVEEYLAKGLSPAKLNLGFALYAKWFHVSGNCTQAGLSCSTYPLEDPYGADSFQSGVMTFEYKNTMKVPEHLALASDGQCGPEQATQCSAGYCCSTEGWCGNTPQHCGYGRCYPAYSSSDACHGPDLWTSWQNALSSPADDTSAGGYTYFDTGNSIFWTWDPIKYVQVKLDEIVRGRCLGGVMVWSLGEEDAKGPAHLNTLHTGIQRLNMSDCRGPASSLGFSVDLSPTQTCHLSSIFDGSSTDSSSPTSVQSVSSSLNDPLAETSILSPIQNSSTVQISQSPPFSTISSDQSPTPVFSNKSSDLQSHTNSPVPSDVHSQSLSLSSQECSIDCTPPADIVTILTTIYEVPVVTVWTTVTAESP